MAGERMIMRRVWAMPNADTFSVKPIGEFVRKYLAKSKVSIDPFARNKRWATHTNDLSPDTKAISHQAADYLLEGLVTASVRADLVLFDPPYSLRQCKEVYESVGRTVTMKDTQDWIKWPRERNAINQLLTPDGVVLSFGWNSNGMGKTRGFELIEVLLVCHGSGHNDTICIAERKQQMGLGE